MVCYLVYIVVEYTSADYAFHSRYRIIVYIAIALLDFLVVNTVNRIVEDLDKEFTDLVEGLVVISEDMTSADISMDEIAGSTENTAEAVTSQSDMTGQIQELLEHTGDLLMN